MPWPSKLSRGCPMTMPLWASIPAHNPNAWISTRVCGGPREAHRGRTWRSTRLAVPFRGQTMEVRGPARSFHVATLWVLVEPYRGHPIALRGQFVGVHGGFVDKCGPAVDIRGRGVGLHPSVRGHIWRHVDALWMPIVGPRPITWTCAVDVPHHVRPDSGAWTYFWTHVLIFCLQKDRKKGPVGTSRKGKKIFCELFADTKKSHYLCVRFRFDSDAKVSARNL